MDAMPIDPATDDALPGRSDLLLSLRPRRGRWDAMLARSTAAVDALRAFPTADRGKAPYTLRQRACAAGAALGGMGGIGGLGAMAAFKPDLGPIEPAALVTAIGAAALPVALCIRCAVAGATPRPAQAAADAAAPSADSTPRGPLQRLVDRLCRRDVAFRRQDRAVARALADIAARESRLAKRIAAGEGAPMPAADPPAADPSPATGLRIAEPRPALPDGPGPAAAAAPPRNPDRRAPQDAAGPGWTMPRDVVEALIDLEARERLHDRRVQATRQAAAAQGARFQVAAPSRPATRGGSAVRPDARRHARIKPRSTRTFIATEDGRRLNATIVDVSQSGVAIEGNLPGLWIGSMVTVGSRRAKAVRVLPRGMAFEFSLPVPADMLTVDFVL